MKLEKIIELKEIQDKTALFLLNTRRNQVWSCAVCHKQKVGLPFAAVGIFSEKENNKDVFERICCSECKECTYKILADKAQLFVIVENVSLEE
jgi:hypothetical protein